CVAGTKIIKTTGSGLLDRDLNNEQSNHLYEQLKQIKENKNYSRCCGKRGACACVSSKIGNQAIYSVDSTRCSQMHTGISPQMVDGCQKHSREHLCTKFQ